MRVLLVGPFPPPHGGVQTHLVAIREFLKRRGVACTVVNITGNRRNESDDVYYPKNAVALVRLLMRLPYDIIHLHYGGNLSLRLLALTLVCCLVPKSRTILTFHSGGYPSSPAGKAAGYWSLRGFVLRRLDGVIGVNAELEKMFLRFGVPAGRTHQIAPHAFVAGRPPDVVRNDTPGSSAATIGSFRTSHTPLLLTVGGLEAEYDIPRQVEAIGMLCKAFPTIGLAVIGGGSQHEQVRALVESKPFRDHILVCGDVAHETTLWAISRSDLLLRTTAYDGDSIAVREALFMGVPVLATDNGMRPEGVHLVAEPGPEALARAIRRCLEREAGAASAVPQVGEKNLEAVWRVYAELSPDRERPLSSDAVAAD